MLSSFRNLIMYTSRTHTIGSGDVLTMKLTGSARIVPLRTVATVANRDGRCCFICRSNGHMQPHHIKARADGGGNAPRNLILVCNSCHDTIEGQEWGEIQRYRALLREERSARKPPSRKPSTSLLPGEHLAFSDKERCWKVWGTDAFGVYSRSASAAVSIA
jgi:hypothetical protein